LSDGKNTLYSTWIDDKAFRSRRPDSKGTILIPGRGDTYVGNFTDDKFNGHGTYTYAAKVWASGQATIYRGHRPGAAEPPKQESDNDE